MKGFVRLVSTLALRSQGIMPQFKAIIILCLIFLLAFTPPTFALSFTGESSLRGLVELKQMAKQSIPYDIALHNAKPTLIEFYADWCTTCQAMATTIHQLPAIAANEVNLVMLNIDDPQWMSLIEDYQVQGVPKFVVLAADGTVQDTLIGRIPKTIFLNLFEQIFS